MPPEASQNDRLVSIVTATRNSAEHLRGLADSLRASKGRFEWIVIDGASTDGTVELLKSLGKLVAAWISERDASVYDAWNKGVERASGHWVMFLGADDRLGDGWIELCNKAPDVDLVYGDLIRLDSAGRDLGRVRSREWKVALKQIPYTMSLPLLGMAFNRRLFHRQRFDPTFKISGDFHFLATAQLKTGVRLSHVQAVMTLGGLSNRPDRVSQAYQENMRVLRESGRRMRWRDRLRWRTKRLVAFLAPGFYPQLQVMSWRLRGVLGGAQGPSAAYRE